MENFITWKYKKTPLSHPRHLLTHKQFHRSLLAFEPVSSSLQKEVTKERVTSADPAAIWDLCRMGGTEHTFPWFLCDNLPWMKGETWPQCPCTACQECYILKSWRHSGTWEKQTNKTLGKCKMDRTQRLWSGNPNKYRCIYMCVCVYI